MSLAIFDLDNTLISDDSDYLWGQFLVAQGVVDEKMYAEANERFYLEYQQGTLDIKAFLHFSLKPLAEHPMSQLLIWRQQFVDTMIKPLLLNSAQQLINKHRALGDTILVITATNRFVTEPIVQLYGITHLLATTPELVNGQYTGNFVEIPCFQDGKVTLLEAWLKESGETMQGSWFYSDSHNDLPLLLCVDHPVAVDPDQRLTAYAQSANWPIISLRNSVCPDHHFHK
ncbi:MAG: HAD-IB family hydrolase [Methylovulum sp.]|nr:HAD-IB family hydrolase [Methylovulum sp.]TSA41256.1 MAG: HAD family hydrolase [Methylococcaceae bacterium]